MSVKENIEELQDKLKYSGFGDLLNRELEKKINSGSSEFDLKITKQMEGKKLDYQLHFRKSDEGKVYYNGFDAKLKTEGKKESVSHRFYGNQGVSAKEALNLLEGRSVLKSLFNKEGERYTAWLQLDLKSKDEKGLHPVNQYHQNYGFDLESTLKKIPVAGMDVPEQKDLLLYSLKKGNLHTVDLNGKKGQFHISANPRFKNLKVVDEKGKRIKMEDLQIKETEGLNEKQEVKQRTSRKQKLN